MTEPSPGVTASHREPERVAERYQRRQAGHRYSLFDSSVVMAVQERQRAMLALLKGAGMDAPETLKLIEVGAGAGGNLLELLRMGFLPEHLAGIELLPERAAAARHVLPEALQVHAADAVSLPLPAEGADIVYQSVVFSSLLDDAFQATLAAAMWQWLRPGGGVLWYDFTYNNPSNPDVRGVPLARVRALFPQGRIVARRVTLAPPIARRVATVSPALYTLLNALPLLRTHLLCWIQKP